VKRFRPGDEVFGASAGTCAEYARVHHLDRDAELLVELPDRVQILEIVSTAGTVPRRMRKTRAPPSPRMK
jgi:NADPH:quinone reductase-like Zn-dependent oxidoreductase